MSRLLPGLMILAMLLFPTSISAKAEGSDWEIIQTEAGPVRYLPRDAGTARRVASLLPGTRDRIARLLEIRVRPRLEVWIAPPETPPPWMSRETRLADWGAGYAFGSSGRIILRPKRSLRTAAPLDLPELLAHEVTHLLVAHLAGPAEREVPRWLHEGLAMQAAGEPPARTLPRLLLAAGFRTLIPLGQLERSWPGDRARAELAYAEAHHFLGYLESRHGLDAMGRLLRRMRRGRSFDSAFRRETGRTVLEAEQEWISTLRRGALLWPLATGGVTLWVILALLVLVGWTRKQIQAREIRQRWDQEDWR